MSVPTISTSVADIEAAVSASILDTLSAYLTMDRQLVAECLAGTGPDVRLSSRVAIVVIARAQAAMGLTDLVDPKKLRPEQMTGIRTTAELLVSELAKRAR